jgi:hypothetical protein
MPAPPLLLVHEEVWRATITLFEPYAREGVEAGLYWYGLRTAEAALATVVGIPQQTNRRRNFDVDPDDLAALTRRLPPSMLVVAQVHTHPGADTTHSFRDDGRALSLKIFSLVLPAYGREGTLEHAGVHEFVDNRWHPLEPFDAARRIIVTPTVIETRHER